MSKALHQLRTYGGFDALRDVALEHEDRLRKLEGRASVDQHEADLAKAPADREFDEDGHPNSGHTTDAVSQPAE